MIQIPEKYTLLTGRGEGSDEILSKNSAFCDAGLNNINNIEVQRELPPECKYTSRPGLLSKGSIVSGVSCIFTSDHPGQLISSVIGVGIPYDPMENGVILGHSDLASVQEVTVMVASIIQDRFTELRLQLQDIRIKGIEHRVNLCGSVIATCLLFSESRGYRWK